MRELDKRYDPQATEAKWYKVWEESGVFGPQPNAEGDPFVIVIPPPNVTGKLHMGHALVQTIQDALIRWNRMGGRPTLLRRSTPS